MHRIPLLSLFVLTALLICGCKFPRNSGHAGDMLAAPLGGPPPEVFDGAPATLLGLGPAYARYGEEPNPRHPADLATETTLETSP